MKIESIQVALRERNPWQAIDLGFDISRQFSGMLYKSYGLSLLIISLPIILALRNYPSWASLLIWYLKPLFEVGPQTLLSRRIFGEVFSNRQIINITLLSIKQHWWAAITSLRFSIRRSFVMPVFLLEGLGAEQRRKRLSTLSLGQSQGPTSLTVLLSHGEVLFYLVLLFIIYQFIPNYERVDPMLIFQPDAEHIGLQWLTIACWLVAVILIAPFYICGGFSLYLNKRIELEGWDLELSFKKIKNRLKNLSTILSCLLLFSLAINNFGSAYAQSAQEFEQEPETSEAESFEPHPIKREQVIPSLQSLIGENEEPQQDSQTNNESQQQAEVSFETEPTDKKINKQTQQEIQEILNNEPLVYIPDGPRWELKSRNRKSSNVNLFGLSFVLEVLLWGAVAAILIWLALQIPQLKKLSKREQGAKRKKVVREAEVFGVKLSPDERQQDLLSAVKEALKNNDPRKALALLLSSALGELANHSEKKIPRGATENDCLLIAHQVNMQKDWLQWFEKLLQRWSFLAWGHKNIELRQIEQLLLNAPLEELNATSGETHG